MRWIRRQADRAAWTLIAFGIMAFMGVDPSAVSRGCKAGQIAMHDADWIDKHDSRCFFYPGRDCPGWTYGGTCQRFGGVVGLDAL